MPFFQFYNSHWLRLSYATFLVQGDWGFPDDVPLALLLDLTPVQVERIGDLSVHSLRLSVRSSNTLAGFGTTMIHQLLNCTLSTLLRLPNMGSGSVTEVLYHLLSLAGSKNLPKSAFPKDVPEADSTNVLAGPEDLEPLTLRREWELFSGLPACRKSLPLEQIALPDEIRRRFQEIGIVHLCDLLDQSVADLCERLGEEATEEVLNALTIHAAEVRLLPDPRVVLEPAQSQEAVLTERWGHRPVTQLKLAVGAVRALRRANVVTVSDLLTALDPLHVELALDPFIFAAIWRRLQALGLREEAWEDARERLSAEAYTWASLDHVMAAWRGSLRPHPWAIVSARLALDKQPNSWRMPTLEEVATQFGVTRERVRQIEFKFIQRLIDRQDDYFVDLQNALKMILFQTGGVISLDQAAEELADWINPGQTAPEGFCRLVLNNSPAFVPLKKNCLYALATQPHPLYQDILGAAAQIAGATAEKLALEDLADAVIPCLPAPPAHEFIVACLRASGDFDHGFPQRIEMLLVRLLRELGSPRHFTELADRLNESGWRPSPVALRYAHHCLLSRRDLFVYVAAGTYGLVEWGIEDQRVERGGERIGDLITEYLEERGIPVSKEEIMAYVLSRKNCRPKSVVHYLYAGRFLRFDQNKYGLSQWTF